MHSYPSPQILPHKEKELNFLPLKCTTFLPCKSFPTWGRSQTVLPRNTKLWGRSQTFSSPRKYTTIPPHKSFSTWGRSQAFFPSQCKAILLRKFFPTWGRVKLSSAKMQSYPSRQIFLILCMEGFFSIMQNFYKSFPTNLYFFLSSFFILSLFIYLFFYFILVFFSYFLKFLFFFA